MAKISLISWRCRERKFPETEAQRRARAREQEVNNDQFDVRRDGLEELNTATPIELLECDEEQLIDEMGGSERLKSDGIYAAADGAFALMSESCIKLHLTPHQSRALQALPLLSEISKEILPHTLLQLSKAEDCRGMTLQFSLHTQAIPEMISLKDVCRRLKVGRRTLMRLISCRELRCYRIGHRYRFAVEDVKRYLQHAATH